MSEIALSNSAVPELPLAGRLSSDERLARLVSRGSERAFALLYQRHHQALYRYCRSILREEQDARDALQSTMTRAFVALRARERDLAVRPWLFRIAHNEAVSILRRRRATGPLQADAERTSPGAEHVAHERERLATLVADLQTLPGRQRTALVMRELSGLSLEEIAAALATSPGAAKQSIFEARRALQEIAEGRAMDCDAVRLSLSERDGRVLRARKLRAHMRSCPGCRDFREAIHARQADLRALAPPLPLAAAGTLLAQLLGGGGGGGGAGGAAVGAGAGGAKLGGLAGPLALKAIAGVAAVTVAAAGSAQLGVAPWRGGGSAIAPHSAPAGGVGSVAGAAGAATALNPAAPSARAFGTQRGAPLPAGASAADSGVQGPPARGTPALSAQGLAGAGPNVTGAQPSPHSATRGGGTGAARGGGSGHSPRRASHGGGAGSKRSGAGGTRGGSERAHHSPAPTAARGQSGGSGQARTPAGTAAPTSQPPAEHGHGEQIQHERSPAAGGGGAAPEEVQQEHTTRPGGAATTQTSPSLNGRT